MTTLYNGDCLEIMKQIEYLNKLHTKEEEILQKSLKEAEEKKQKEEQAKQDRLNQMKKAFTI